MTHRLASFALVFSALVGCAARADESAPPAASAEARAQSLERKIETLSRELDALKNELKQVENQNEALAAQQQQQAVLAQQQSAVQNGGGPWDRLSLWGYGEVNYYHPQHRPEDTQADLARAVFGIGYRFGERTVFNSEYEVEHAVSSADDPGEFEVEQFWVDHRFAGWGAVKAGLFLMPFGLLNEHHEPTNYYGVQRNFVETLIIPSTWREGGVGLHGDTVSGLGWDLGLTTGFDLSKYELNPETPLYGRASELKEASPLQATHQELALANAQHLAQYLALNYHGLPGFLFGAAVFTGNAGRVDRSAHLPDSRLTLWEAHARWRPGRADFAAVFARGTLGDTAATNALNPGASNPLPGSFFGYYLQGAYDVWRRDQTRLAPFLRWERYNVGASYAGLAAGFAAVPAGFPQPYDRVWTYGMNFYLNPHVVFKADYQSFQNNADFTRFDLGVGLNF